MQLAHTHTTHTHTNNNNKDETRADDVAAVRPSRTAAPQPEPLLTSANPSGRGISPISAKEGGPTQLLAHI